jgi:hypothetical protein
MNEFLKTQEYILQYRNMLMEYVNTFDTDKQIEEELVATRGTTENE